MDHAVGIGKRPVLVCRAEDNPLIRPSATFSPEAGEKGPVLCM